MKICISILSLQIIAFLSSITFASHDPIDPQFVDITSINKNVRVEARYASEWNFLARSVSGYLAPKCLLTNEAAQALSAVEKDVEKDGFRLLAFDCYRPQRAVNDFVTWVAHGVDSSTKSFFYPGEDRQNLIVHGYIAGQSGHSRGSTIDLTLINADSKLTSFRENFSDCRKPEKTDQVHAGQLDMGTSFDCFSELAHTANASLSAQAKMNRARLKAAMERHGFKNYAKEWWHYTLVNEPYKTQYFDFEVQ